MALLVHCPPPQSRGELEWRRRSLSAVPRVRQDRFRPLTGASAGCQGTLSFFYTHYWSDFSIDACMVLLPLSLTFLVTYLATGSVCWKPDTDEGECEDAESYRVIRRSRLLYKTRSSHLVRSEFRSPRINLLLPVSSDIYHVRLTPVTVSSQSSAHSTPPSQDVELHAAHFRNPGRAKV